LALTLQRYTFPVLASDFLTRLVREEFSMMPTLRHSTQVDRIRNLGCTLPTTSSRAQFQIRDPAVRAGRLATSPEAERRCRAQGPQVRARSTAPTSTRSRGEEAPPGLPRVYNTLQGATARSSASSLAFNLFFTAVLELGGTVNESSRALRSSWMRRDRRSDLVTSGRTETLEQLRGDNRQHTDALQEAST